MDQLISLTVIGFVFAALAFSKLAADIILMTALATLIISGVLTPAEGLAGFSNPGVITIAVLYVVAAGLKETGAVQWLASGLLGNPKSNRSAIGKLVGPSAIMSGFMSNTAVVAMFIPAIQDWANRIGVSASKLLIPLSYSAILGGTCTLIGTSTNLVVDGLLQTSKEVELGMFSIAQVGIPITLAGLVFLYLFAERLLPDNEGSREQLGSVREYSVEMAIKTGSPLAGRTIEEAKLRSLKFGYLVEVQRSDRLLSAVSPDTVLYAKDILVFIGSPECARELQHIQGLEAVHGETKKLGLSHHERCLIEAVIGPDFSGLNQTIRESKFRSRFQAAILSVSRNGQRIAGKIGDIQLQVGDTLLLEAGQDFVAQYRSRRDFLLVSAINDSNPPAFEKAPLAIGILLSMIVLSSTGLLSILEASMIAGGAMVLTKCVSITNVRRHVDLMVLVVIAASFSLGAAMTKSGAAELIASQLIALGHSPWMMLALVYLLTVVFTELITNNAAAVMMFPIAISIADQLGVNYMPFVIAIMIAASASFITPLGYQTNLMVMGAGGYKLHDFVRIGLPLSILIAMVAIALIPLIWSF